ncbi:hypothetical protein [Marinicella meishanensis]|uniref:hypothetical protein n=1 Tax=Marinicella meishanensis TaxID=2873263 RepID=UPI001CC0BACD|nr:hypothetical protein [Marinicella sp. NBU2979]
MKIGLGVLLWWPLSLLAGGLSMFTLPPRDTCEGAYFIDIQASFPQVNFSTLDRLYIPAGHYSFYRIGQLTAA